MLPGGNGGGPGGGPPPPACGPGAPTFGGMVIEGGIDGGIDPGGGTGGKPGGGMPVQKHKFYSQVITAFHTSTQSQAVCLSYCF